MPKRTDISSILVIGAGPIIIGQACEFDYSGTQAIKALKEEGYRVILVNSNPATIMTDPEFADATYIEPITPDIVAKIIAKERPDALAADDGRADGAETVRWRWMQTATLEKIRRRDDRGAKADAIDKAEKPPAVPRCDGRDRAGKRAARAWRPRWNSAREILERTGLPSIIRPSFYALAALAGGLPITRRNSTRSCAKVSTHRLPPKC